MQFDEGERKQQEVHHAAGQAVASAAMTAIRRSWKRHSPRAGAVRATPRGGAEVLALLLETGTDSVLLSSGQHHKSSSDARRGGDRCYNLAIESTI